jgi:N-formylglutamate deformylase
VFAAPHSGRAYAPEFLAASRLGPLALRRSEDAFVDQLFDTAPDHGAPLLVAEFPRAWCDANREPWELDPGMFEDALPPWVNAASPRVAAGLGTIARVVASGEAIYRGRLRFRDAEARVETCWRPYHDTLGALIAATKAQHGFCALIDCHSMPSHGQGPRGDGRQPDFVLGDAHGTACAPAIARYVERALTDMGYAVRRNDPYAGGFVTRHYGRPRDGAHALQIEIARELYMDEARIEKAPGFDALRADIARLVEALARDVDRLVREG